MDDLTNIRNSLNPLVATVQATGWVMDQAQMNFKMTLDPFAYHPTFHMALRLLGLDVTKLNALSRAYGKFDFKHSWLDLVVQADSKESRIDGYVKPLSFETIQLSYRSSVSGEYAALNQNFAGLRTSLPLSYLIG